MRRLSQIAVLFALFATCVPLTDPASAQARGGARWYDWADSDEGERSSASPLQRLLADAACLGGVIVIVLVYLAVQSKNGSPSTSNRKPSARSKPVEASRQGLRPLAVSQAPPLTEEERKARRAEAAGEVDLAAWHRGEAPEVSEREINSLLVARGVPNSFGYLVSKDALDQRYRVVSEADFGEGDRVTIKAIVASTPVIYDERFPSFRSFWGEHGGTVMFSLNLIDVKAYRALSDLLRERDEGIDHGEMYQRAMPMSRRFSKGEKVELPEKGDEIDVVLERSRFTDESGTEVLMATDYSIPPPRRHPLRRRRRPSPNADLKD